MATQNQAASPQTLRIIRFALLGGILIFGAIALFMSSSGMMDPMDESVLSILLIVFFVLAAAEGGVMYFFHLRWKKAKTQQQKASLSIVGWALAEGVALFGAVLALLGGGIVPYLCGLALFGVAWLLFPIAPEEASTGAS